MMAARLMNTWNKNWFLLLTKFSPPVNLLTYKISSLFKLTIILIPLMLSHLLIHSSPLHWKSLITASGMPCLTFGTNFLLHFVNQFHLFMLMSIHSSLLHFLHPSLLHSKLTFSVNRFHHRSLTTEIPHRLPRLMRPFSVSTLRTGFSSWFGVVD